MGDPITAAAGAASLASVGFQAYGSLEKGKGAAAADQFQAQQEERAAQYGKLQAEQVGSVLTQKLAITLGNIDSVRAAAHTDPTSPTGVAMRDASEKIGLEQKSIQVDNIMEQTRQQEADAAYLRKASSQALLMGEIGAGADITKGIGQGLGSPLFGF